MLWVSKIKVESRYSKESDLGIGFFFEKISEIITPANFHIFSMNYLGGRSHTFFSMDHWKGRKSKVQLW